MTVTLCQVTAALPLVNSKKASAVVEGQLRFSVLDVPPVTIVQEEPLMCALQDCFPSLEQLTPMHARVLYVVTDIIA